MSTETTRTLLALGVAAAAVIAAPVLVKNQYQLGIVTTFFIASIVALGLNVLVGLTGLLSLGQAGFYAIGAYGAASLSLQFDVPLIFGVLLPAAAAALVGVALAYPSAQVRGFYLAVVTISFGIIIQSLAIEWVALTGGPTGLMGVKLPALLVPGGERLTPRGLYYVIGGVFIVALLMTLNLRRSSYGRAFRAVAQSETAARALGIRPVAARTLAFAISAAFAGAGGALYAYQNQYVNPETFGFIDSVRFLLMVILGGSATWLGPVIGAGVLAILPELFQSLLEWQTLAYGALLALVIFALPDGIAGVFMRLWRRIRSSRKILETGAWPSTGVDLSDILPVRAASASPAVKIDGLSVWFGGLTALDNLSETIAGGSVHGIIGPNGAGKSTLVNVLSGFYRPSGGRVAVFGDTSKLREGADGIARTFQNTELFGTLTALENVLVAFHPRTKAALAEVLLGLPRRIRDEHESRSRALRLLSYVGLANYADVEASSLPFGHQRRLEIARALARSPQVLLLDEPAAGLTHAEIFGLGTLIRDIAGRGVTVLLIEHHIDLTLSVCDRITVLDYGRLIFSGRGADLRNDSRVRDVYLGIAELPPERAGAAE